MDRKKQDAPGPYLEYVTLTTGDSRRSPRAEVAADVLQALGPVLVEALESGEAVDVCGTGWYLSACEDAGKLQFRLHVERPDIQAAAPIRCIVIPGPGAGAILSREGVCLPCPGRRRRGRVRIPALDVERIGLPWTIRSGCG